MSEMQSFLFPMLKEKAKFPPVLLPSLFLPERETGTDDGNVRIVSFGSQ